MDNARKRRRHGNSRGGVSDHLHSSQLSGVCASTRWARPELAAGCSTAHNPSPSMLSDGPNSNICFCCFRSFLSAHVCSCAYFYRHFGSNHLFRGQLSSAFDWAGGSTLQYHSSSPGHYHNDVNRTRWRRSYQTYCSRCHTAAARSHVLHMMSYSSFIFTGRCWNLQFQRCITEHGLQSFSPDREEGPGSD